MTTIDKVHKCLCGETGIRLNNHNGALGACHCSMCRKWSGGPFMTITIDEGISIEGEQNVAFFSSSDWAERAFSKNCGTHLFYRIKQNGQAFVPAGLVDEGANLEFDHQIFIDEKPDYYNFSETTHNMTGDEVFAAFAPPE